MIETMQRIETGTRAPAVPGRVVVINDASFARGGATGIALSSAELLQARGVDVTFISGDSGEQAAALGHRFEIVPLGGTHILGGPRVKAALDGLYNGAAERFLAAWIARNDTPDTVYHLHGWSKVLSPSIFRALKPVAPRLVVNAHDFFLVCPNGGFFNFRTEKPCDLAPMSLACLGTNCDRRHYAHKLWRSARQGVRRLLSDLGRSDSTILAVHEGMLPHLARGGLAGARLRALRNPAAPWRSQRIEAERNRTFVFVGRLESDKGPDLLAAAARKAGVPLKIIGGGPLDAMLASDYPEAERVGWKTRAEIVEEIADVRALVMPSRYREPFGLVAMEALTSGLPIVVPSYAMLAQDVTEGGFGLACDPHDVDALAGALGRLAADDALLAQMSLRAHREAHRLAPTQAEWTDALLGLYADLLAGENRRPEPTDRSIRWGSAA
ncbi:glycosyltransferase family 4 protein [Labrys monachus]|uniref:Glycosyltransferase involved in cell wall biosynthesis n=1 Tax=Labrys monachus TaxID=217067 RepID=A0ABU0FA05_9HYPH|nr:glycosyltransferase family 4 protein [Labrys monachus]MDQ0391444.1 glycosyltransferase involved in cell wall biosynthesis [Labrys monachus]